MGLERAGVPVIKMARFARCTTGRRNWVRLALWDFKAWLSSHTTTPKLRQRYTAVCACSHVFHTLLL